VSILIRNGRISDGTGNPWYRGDVLVEAGRIAAVGRCLRSSAERIIDADGLVVAPGFIDIHSHSDTALLVSPWAESKIRQGVTTEVVGNCGESLAPLAGEAVSEAAAELEELGVELKWRSLGEYLNCLEERGTAVNVAALVGHGTLRKSVVGYRNRVPTEAELGQMREMLAMAMSEGAFGLSTGLIYAPGSYAKTDELIAMAAILPEYGGIYASHIRNEGKDLLAAVDEAIRIGREAGVPVQISHHKASSDIVWGKVKETCRMIEAARAGGLDVTADQYPYIATSTTLTALLPDWAHDGGQSALLARLRDSQLRAQLVDGIRSKRWHRDNWEQIVIASVGSETNKKLEGKNLLEIAGLWDTTGPEVIIDLLAAEEGNVSMVVFAMCEEDVRYVMQQHFVMVGSDGSCLAPEGSLGQGKPHPRHYGTFPRVLGHYARNEAVITLEDAVRKMTSLPARRLGITDRGVLMPGMRADITIFDPATVIDTATFDDPHHYPDGVEYVIVNGQIGVEKGENKRIPAGQILRRQA
jgi:N-acyl-D-amino-acid deacylase